MANADAPFGLRPVMMMDGSPYNGHAIECVLLAADSTATFIGDAVKLSGTASADGTKPSVAQCAAGDEIFGVVTSFEYDPDDLTLQYRKASTLRTCYVVPALDCLFEIQEDSVGGALAITDVGATFDLVVGSGNTTTGLSGMELDSSTAADNGLQVIKLAAREDNAIGNNANWIVRINESALRGDGTAV
jgi:hypothetical protein